MSVTSFIFSGHKLTTAYYIREYLKINKKGSIYDFYEGLMKEKKEIRKQTPVRYSSVRVIVYMLRRSGVIRDVRDDISPKLAWTLHPKKIIELVPGKENDPIWDDVWISYKGKDKSLIKEVEEEELGLEKSKEIKDGEEIEVQIEASEGVKAGDTIEVKVESGEGIKVGEKVKMQIIEEVKKSKKKNELKPKISTEPEMPGEG